MKLCNMHSLLMYLVKDSHKKNLHNDLNYYICKLARLHITHLHKTATYWSFFIILLELNLVTPNFNIYLLSRFLSTYIKSKLIVSMAS